MRASIPVSKSPIRPGDDTLSAAQDGSSTTAVIAVIAVAAFVTVLMTALAADAIDRSDSIGFVATALAHGAAYAVACALLLHRGGPAFRVGTVLLVALLLRGLAMTPAANLSTDAYRYVWDGRIQAAGYNPYAHVPADPRLAHLRDAAVYPHINQKERAVTIYPPAAELLFGAAQWVGDDVASIRIVMLGMDIAVIGALLALLASLGLPLNRVALYAWHPLPLWEFAGHGHIDAAATALIVLGLLAAVRGRQGWSGAIFAVAALTKYFPLVLLPALWRRRDWRLPAALVAVGVALYLPYLRGSGGNLLGFLGSHLDNEGYAAGWGFHAVWLLRDFSLGDMSGRAYVIGALALLGGLALYCLLARGRDEIRPGHVLALGAAFVFLTSPHYAWYFAFLVPLLALVPHPAAFAFTLLAPVLYLPQPPAGLSWSAIYLIVYWLPLALLVAVAAWRAAFSSRSASPGDRRDAHIRSSGSGS